jgi:hypothetical protein
MLVKGMELTYTSPSTSQRFWAHAKGEINVWMTKYEHFEVDGLSGDPSNLIGMERWTATAAGCLALQIRGT